MINKEKLNELSELNKYINLDDALKRVRGNKGIYKRLLTSYKKTNYVTQITEEVNNIDFESAKKTVHALKGLSANISLVKIHSTTVQMEELLKNDTDCKELVEELKKSTDETNKYVDYLIETL